MDEKWGVFSRKHSVVLLFSVGGLLLSRFGPFWGVLGAGQKSRSPNSVKKVGLTTALDPPGWISSVGPLPNWG